MAKTDETTKVKLSVSLDSALVDSIDSEASKHGATRSGLLNLIVTAWDKRRVKRAARQKSKPEAVSDGR